MGFLKFTLLIIAIEALLALLFYTITPKSIRVHNKIDVKSISKGVVERLFLVVALVNGYPHALTLFGTLKLATRLRRDAEGNKIKEVLYNDFYLLGNFISITAAFGYTFLYHLMSI